MEKFSLILASASPRRKEILTQAGYEFEVMPSDASEVFYDGDIERAVKENAELKAKSVFEKLSEPENTAVIGADTLVSLNGKILGKPKDERDAFSMLSMLSGKYHEVETGVCVIGRDFLKSDVSVTKVKFRDLSEKEIKDYIKTGEPMDKAGAYGIQEKGCVLAERIEGDFFNVVGLPIVKVHSALQEFIKYIKA